MYYSVSDTGILEKKIPSKLLFKKKAFVHRILNWLDKEINKIYVIFVYGI